MKPGKKTNGLGVLSLILQFVQAAAFVMVE